jgi:hypothetical protein
MSDQAKIASHSCRRFLRFSVRAMITDAGLVYLNGMTAVKSLDLDFTHVTGAGLAHPKGRSNLGEVGLEGTQVTDAGLRDLQQALPSLKIDR